MQKNKEKTQGLRKSSEWSVAKRISCFELQNNTQEHNSLIPICVPNYVILVYVFPSLFVLGHWDTQYPELHLDGQWGSEMRFLFGLQLTEVLRLVSGQALGQPLGFIAINCSKLESLQMLSMCVKGIRAKIRGRNRVRQQGCKAFCERSDFKGKNPFSGWRLGRNSEPHWPPPTLQSRLAIFDGKTPNLFRAHPNLHHCISSQRSNTGMSHFCLCYCTCNLWESAPTCRRLAKKCFVLWILYDPYK